MVDKWYQYLVPLEYTTLEVLLLYYITLHIVLETRMNTRCIEERGVGGKDDYLLIGD